MHLAVAHTFEPGIIPRLAAFPAVGEIYGKIDHDPVGGGRARFTLRPTTMGDLRRAVAEAHSHNIRYSYLLNAAGLYGLEQTRSGQRSLRRHLDRLADAGVDGVTVSLPYLCSLVKQRYPQWRVKVGVFATIDSPLKARQWEDLGADELCLSSISCARNFDLLARIRSAVDVHLQLIANASCLLSCVHEGTHMHLLSQASGSRAAHGGFVLDYCFLNCSAARVADPVNLIKAVWIRPEDLGVYEDLGINSFKIVERSCPGDLLVKRVSAYAERSFAGNLWEIVGPIANIKKQNGAPFTQRLRMITSQFRPHLIKTKALLAMKDYAETVIPHEYGREKAPVYIDNAALEGFLAALRKRGCTQSACGDCRICADWAQRAVTVDEAWQKKAAGMAKKLTAGLYDGSHWE